MKISNSTCRKRI